MQDLTRIWDNLLCGVKCEAANTATALAGITVPSCKNKSSYELFYGKPPHYMENL